jgi:hypothetical protein
MSTPARNPSYLAATFARELVEFLSGTEGPARLRLESGRLDADVALSVRRPLTPAPVPRVQHRHLLSLTPTGPRSVSADAPLWPPGTLVITNNPAALTGCEPPTDSRLLQVGADPTTEADVERLCAEVRPHHVRVIVDLAEVTVTDGWSDPVVALLRLHDATFLTARACLRWLDGDSTFTVVVLGGISAVGVPYPLAGLFSGFVKALRLELPTTRVLAVIHDAVELAGAERDILAEASAPDPVAYYAAGQRFRLTARPEPAVPGQSVITGDSVVLAAGGARGIGAELLKALARTVSPRIYVLGSSALSPDTISAAGRREHILQRTRGPDAVSVAVANAASNTSDKYKPPSQNWKSTAARTELPIFTATFATLTPLAGRLRRRSALSRQSTYCSTWQESTAQPRWAINRSRISRPFETCGCAPI